MKVSLGFRNLQKLSAACLTICLIAGCLSTKPNEKDEQQKEHEQKQQLWAEPAGKPVIYQVLVRLFGNQNLTNQLNGSIEQNGAGKFNDITDRALDSIKGLGITHIWYTGVLEHATMTDYTKFGIALDDPDVVKGRAGSPYAVKDYYDVDPDLAVNVNERLQEFQALIGRTHEHGLKVVMDFIPNHVARGYHSDRNPKGVIDFGADDDTTLRFSPQNDFYYLPGTSFKVPAGVDPGGRDFHSLLKDGKFKEVPAKVTGNNVLRPDPSIDDWYETIKLNYGIDLFHADAVHFNPVPPVWKKMRDILLYWAAQGVDGFRCDVAEMVPLAFWKYAIGAVKAKYPDLIFIAEAYDPAKYSAFTAPGVFDYLYNKVGLYDVLKPILRNDSNADTKNILEILNKQASISSHLLNFLENHDEQRIASTQFAGDAYWGEAAMGVAATATTGPVLIYFGQELGVNAPTAEGFGGADGKTTIFDYWGLPIYQKWVDKGKYDGKGLNKDQKGLRAFYRQLLNLAANSSAIRKGKLYLLSSPDLGKYGMCYLRYDQGETLLFAANFDHKQSLNAAVHLPDLIRLGKAAVVDVAGTRQADHAQLSNRKANHFTFDISTNTVHISLSPGGFLVWKIR